METHSCHKTLKQTNPFLQGKIPQGTCNQDDFFLYVITCEHLAVDLCQSSAFAAKLLWASKMHVAFNSTHVPWQLPSTVMHISIAHVDCSQPNCDMSLLKLRNDMLHSTSQNSNSQSETPMLPSVKIPNATTDEIGSTLSTWQKVQFAWHFWPLPYQVPLSLPQVWGKILPLKQQQHLAFKVEQPSAKTLKNGN